MAADGWPPPAWHTSRQRYVPALLCFTVVWFGTVWHCAVWCSLVWYVSYAPPVLLISDLASADTIYLPHHHTQVTLVFETIVSAGYDFILHACSSCIQRPAVSINFWLIRHIQLISVSANHCLRLQCLVVSIIQRVQISVSSNLNLERLTLEPASHEFGAYAVEKHQLGGSHSGKVSRRRKSGQATLEVGHVTI